jgi:molecular chaperone DnaK
MSSQQSIAYGIDLGTTNSSIAILRGDDVHVVPSRHDMRITPSVVAFSVKGGQVSRAEVGMTARQKLKLTPGLVCRDMKSQMGEPNWRFAVPGTSVAESATELSARVLRELTDSLQKDGALPPLQGAVITVPAIFNAQAREDTLRAGKAAGIGHVQLFPEPEAAALAFGHKAGTQGHPVWLVYDLGGGTFDTAIVRGEDGVFTKVATDGDRHLGGTNLDEAIVRELMLPRLPDALRAKVVQGGTVQRNSVWWQLVFIAEQAKIALDTAEEYSFGDAVEDFDLDLRLARGEVEALQVRLFGPTLDICRRVLAQSRYESRHIDRVVLVGGPTRSPFLRRMLEKGIADAGGGARVAGLGIALDASVDPMTAVAQGAALFAATQRLPRDATVARPAGADAVAIEHHTPAQVLPDDGDVIATGRVTSTGAAVNERWSVEIVRLEERGEGWRSEPIALKANGGFARRVDLHRGQNRFEVKVFDDKRQPRPTGTSGVFEVMRGIQTSERTLDRGLGIADHLGLTQWFFQRNDPIPGAAVTIPLRTTVRLARDSAEEIVIPLVEGNEERADLNAEIYALRIPYNAVQREIPQNAIINVSLAVDANSIVTMKAHFADYDVPIAPRQVGIGSDITVGDARAKLVLVKKNLELFRDVRRQSQPIDKVVADIDEGEYVAEVETLLREGSDQYPQAWSKAHALVLKMLRLQQPHLGRVDELLSWAQVLARCDKNMRIIHDRVNETEGLSADWTRRYEELRSAYAEAVRRQDKKEAVKIAFNLMPEHLCRIEKLREFVEEGADPLKGTDERETAKPTPIKGTVERR